MQLTQLMQPTKLRSLVAGVVKRISSVPGRKYKNRWAGNDIFYGRNEAGMYVNQHTAMQLAPVQRAVNYISDMLMVLPWAVHAQGENFSSVRIRSDLDSILNVSANPEIDARTWRNTMARYVLLGGNAYAQIIRNNAERPIALGLPIPRNMVYPWRDEQGRLIYQVTAYDPVSGRGNLLATIPAYDMFHVKGYGDGYAGYSVIEYGARTMGIRLAMDESQASFFANGSRTSGVLSASTPLSNEARDNLEKYLKEHIQGPRKAFNMLVLEEGMKWEQMGIPNDQAQLAQLMNLNVLEIARLFNLPPHILMDYSSAKWNSLEHASTEAVLSGILPWAIRFETEANRKLILRQNVGRLTTKINLKGLLRADTQTRNEAYAKGRQWGWLSANDVRALEDLPPVDGGDIYLTPMNMQPADQVAAQGQNNAQNNAQNSKDLKLIMKAQRVDPGKALVEKVFRNAWSLIIDRENNVIFQYRKRDDFADRMERWFNGHRKFIWEQVRNCCDVLAEAGFTPVADIDAEVSEYAHHACNGVIDAWHRSELDNYCDASSAYLMDTVMRWTDIFKPQEHEVEE